MTWPSLTAENGGNNGRKDGIASETPWRAAAETRIWRIVTLRSVASQAQGQRVMRRDVKGSFSAIVVVMNRAILSLFSRKLLVETDAQGGLNRDEVKT